MYVLLLVATFYYLKKQGKTVLTLKAFNQVSLLSFVLLVLITYLITQTIYYS